MKKMITFVLCAIITLSLAACGKDNNGAKRSTKPDSGRIGGEPSTLGTEADSNVGIANPFVDCQTIEEAGKVAGFDMIAPEKVDGYTDCEISAIENDMIQVNYKAGDEQLCIRKATGNEDVSGNYETFSEEKTVTVGDVQVIEKGENGLIQVATWKNGGYSYSVDSDTGLSGENMETLIQKIR